MQKAPPVSPPPAAQDPGPHLLSGPKNARKSFSSQRAKAIYRFIQALSFIASQAPIIHCGMLHLRFAEDVDLKEARVRFKALRYILQKLFKTYCGVFEFGRRGHIHIHVFFVAHEDIAVGFDQDSYERFTILARWIASEKHPSKERLTAMADLLKRLTPNLHLQELRKQLNRIATNHDFQPVRSSDIAPLRKAPIAAALYMAKGLYADPSRRRRYVKGQSMLIMPKLNERPVRGNFSWATGKSKEYRTKRQHLGSYFGTTMEEFKALHPNNWHKILGSLQKAIERKNPYWPYYIHPEFDPARFAKRWVWEHGLWDFDLGPEPDPYPL